MTMINGDKTKQELDEARERALAKKEAAHEPPADAIRVVTAVGRAPSKAVSRLAFADTERIEEARAHSPEFVGDPEAVETVEATSTVLDSVVATFADKRTEFVKENDTVNHPAHYTGHPSGVECITVVEHMNFNLGNAVKYIWRAGDKGNLLEDLQKAAWYIQREIQRVSEAGG